MSFIVKILKYGRKIWYAESISIFFPISQCLSPTLSINTFYVERKTEYCNKLCIIQQQSVQRNILIITVSINNDSIFWWQRIVFGSKFSVLNFRWFYLKRFLGIHAESNIKIRFELNRARQNSGQTVDGSQNTYKYEIVRRKI